MNELFEALREEAESAVWSRGVELVRKGAVSVESRSEGEVVLRVLVRAGRAAPAVRLHPRDASAFLNHDIYRLSVSAAGQGWSARLANALAAIRFGETQPVAVHVERAPDAAASGTVTLQAASESDPGRTATANCAVSR